MRNSKEKSVFGDYKHGKISLGKSAKQLNLTISEMIELLAEFGISSPITYEDYLQGYKALTDGFGVAKGGRPFEEEKDPHKF